MAISEAAAGHKFEAVVAQRAIKPVSVREEYSAGNVEEFHFAFVSATGGPGANRPRLLSLTLDQLDVVLGYCQLGKLKVGEELVTLVRSECFTLKQKPFCLPTQITARALSPSLFVSVGTRFAKGHI